VRRNPFQALVAATALALFACGLGKPAAAIPSSIPTARTAAPSSSPHSTPFPLQTSAQVATAIATAEMGIRNPETSQARLVELGMLEQLAYLKLAQQPDWLPDALSAVPSDVRPAIQNNFDALTAVADLNPPVSNLPDWKIVKAPPPEQLRAYYSEAERVFGVPWYYLAAIHFIETDFSRVASDSPAGAQGPMQFIPTTWAAYGQGDVHDTHDAILAAGHYLKASGAPGDMPRAIHSYNPDGRYVTAVMRYAANMQADQRAFLGYYHWRVYVQTKQGAVFLNEPSG
jgi:membrane-bound lytic murein transglycosylase B